MQGLGTGNSGIGIDVGGWEFGVQGLGPKDRN